MSGVSTGSSVSPNRQNVGQAIPRFPAPYSPVASNYIADRFGRRLRDLRKQHGMTQLDMAIAFGIDRSFISDVERGKKSISLPLIEIIAVGFSMSISDLFSDI